MRRSSALTCQTITKNKKKKTMTKDVPSELVRDILFLLPVKSLIRFKSISKTWRSEIEDPIFVKSHLLLQSTRPDSTRKMLFLRKSRGKQLFLADDVDSLDHAVEVKPNFNCSKRKDFDDPILVGSCNGLACFVDTRESRIIIWNIPVNDYKSILLPKNKKSALNSQFHVYGFGYDSINDDYKVVRMYYVEYMIYSVRKNAWKKIPAFPNLYFLETFCTPQPSLIVNGIFVSGTVHWLGFKHSKRTLIDAVDLARERSVEVPLPDCLVDMHVSKMNIGEIQGCLYVTTLTTWDRVDLWVMKDYMVKESWMKLFSINEDYFWNAVRVFGHSRTGKKVLLHKRGMHHPRWFDMEKSELQPEDETIDIDENNCMHTYMETLVSVSSYAPAGDI